MPALNTLANQTYDETSIYSDRIHFAHLYVIEPHPQAPDISPYSDTGNVWEEEYSTVSQALTYDERVAAAQDIAQLLEGNQLILVDDLAPGLNNPVWCTYGPCPNCAYLIGQDGVIDTTQTWFNADQMKIAIDNLLE